MANAFEVCVTFQSAFFMIFARVWRARVHRYERPNVQIYFKIRFKHAFGRFDSLTSFANEIMRNATPGTLPLAAVFQVNRAESVVSVARLTSAPVEILTGKTFFLPKPDVFTVNYDAFEPYPCYVLRSKN